MTGTIRSSFIERDLTLSRDKSWSNFLKKSCLRSFIFLLGGLLQATVFASQATEVFFANKTWKIDINVETLQVRGGVSGGPRDLILSGPQPKSLRISDLKVSEREAHWYLPENKLSVSMRLDPEALLVEFHSQEPGEFTWPILPPQRSLRAYILPIGQGSYVPVDDKQWGTYLLNLGSLSTTEGLSLPLWGVQDSKHTYTYLLTTPFNNELSFNVAHGVLASALTHHFTRINKAKTFGCRISLGSLSPVEPAKQYRSWLQQTGQFVSMRDKIRRTPDAAKLLGAAHVYLWGDGMSTKMLDALKSNGFDRLWLGAPNWKELQDNPRTIEKAKAYGYLVGPYDSYDSVHSPKAKPDDTWETAQFDQKLYDTGAIELSNGAKKAGFQQQGFYVSEKAAEPYVKERVSRLMKAFACNSWFIDCDAAGEFYEDFSRAHPATQEDEMQARLRRLAWIRDTYHLVVGSEGGVAYSAGTIHFAHGIMSPIFGWGDLALKAKSSPNYLGAYYPPSGPAVFFKQVPLAPSYYHVLFDPRFRLPLYETVFHDSVIVTNHWTLPTLKFSDQMVERTLMEQLYNVSPLYHLNSQEFVKRMALMKAQYAFFSPLHRLIGQLPMTDFAWLTDDHLVQRTTFGDRFEIVTNFQLKPFAYAGQKLQGQSVLALDRTTGKETVYKPNRKLKNH